MREKLKASYIAKLKCPKERDQIKVFDTKVTGLAVRITKLGVKTLFLKKDHEVLRKLNKKRLEVV